MDAKWKYQVEIVNKQLFARGESDFCMSKGSDDLNRMQEHFDFTVKNFGHSLKVKLVKLFEDGSKEVIHTHV